MTAQRTARVTMQGRRCGSIGIFYPITESVDVPAQATDNEIVDAWRAKYQDTYETNYRIAIDGQPCKREKNVHP